jgi:hypothetical protein
MTEINLVYRVISTAQADGGKGGWCTEQSGRSEVSVTTTRNFSGQGWTVEGRLEEAWKECPGRLIPASNPFPTDVC